MVTFLSLNLVVLPLAQGQQNWTISNSAVETELKEAIAQISGAQNRLGDEVKKFGLTIVNSQNEQTTLDNVFATNQNGFALVTPADQQGQRFAIQIDKGPRANLDKMQVKFRILKYDERQTLTKLPRISGTAITILPGEDAKAIRLSIYRAGQFLNQSISSRFSRVQKGEQNFLARAFDLLLPKAEAQTVESAITKCAETAAILGAIAMVGSALGLILDTSGMDGIPSFDSTPGKIFIGGAIVLAVAGLAKVISNTIYDN